MAPLHVDELSHVFSPMAVKETLVDAASLFFLGGGAGGSSGVQGPALALERKVRKLNSKVAS